MKVNASSHKMGRCIFDQLAIMGGAACKKKGPMRDILYLQVKYGEGENLGDAHLTCIDDEGMQEKEGIPFSHAMTCPSRQLEVEGSTHMFEEHVRIGKRGRKKNFHICICMHVCTFVYVMHCIYI
jgi:hypothetical protein